MDLFERRRDQLVERDGPLAARMRPRTLDEFIGQEAIVGPGRLLRRAIQADQLSSVLFYGPPGTGKTTLARIIANTTKSQFVSLNAVLAGVKDIREAIEQAKDARGMHGRKTILFVDEVHRFNKAQQDALLPWVENGTVILIGATTENPFFEVNKALVSRSRVFQLQPLGPEGLERVARAALADPHRGYGARKVDIAEDALAHLVDVANGDARALLNALELAVDTTEADAEGRIHLDLRVAEESIQKRAVLYDKEGDAHFDTISAFIKSCRGSDPDAALYWLARMVYAGEDPRFILRRMIILASEDVGLADPDVLARVLACAEAFDRIGLPEGRFPLAQAALTLATAKKSNSTMGFFDALAAVEKEREGEVPNHLKDPSRDKEGFGHGAGYAYPHAFRDHWVAQQYLPSTLRGQVFYQPSEVGFEATIREEVARRREAQLALADADAALGLSFGPSDRQVDRWLARALAEGGERLGQLRDALFARAAIDRHHVVLDLDARSGLLTWEALRRTPEGGVYALADAASPIRDRARGLPELQRPSISATLEDLDPALRFDRVLGHNALGPRADRVAWLSAIAARLAPGARIVVAERLPRHTPRLSELVPCDHEAAADWRAAEERLYAEELELAFDAEALRAAFEDAGLVAELERETTKLEIEASPALIERWWGGVPGRPSYAERLGLPAATLEALREWSRRRWARRRVVWSTTTAYAVARRA